MPRMADAFFRVFPQEILYERCLYKISPFLNSPDCPAGLQSYLQAKGGLPLMLVDPDQEARSHLLGKVFPIS